MTEFESETLKGTDIELKLKAKMVDADEQNFTLQVYPLNIEWKYLEAESEYLIKDTNFKIESIRQIVRNVLLKYKEFMYSSVKVGSKDYLFEVQVPKGVDTEKLKNVFTQIANEIKNEISKSKSKLEHFKKFLEDTEF